MPRGHALAVVIAWAGCATHRAPPPPTAGAPAFALPERQLAESGLALEVAPAPVVIVPPRGAVELGGAQVELAGLGRTLTRAGAAPADVWQAPPVAAPQPDAAALGVNPGAFDGTVLVRVAAVRDRPIAVIERDVSMLRLFEVTRAAQPIGLAIAVADRARPGPRVFAFRAADPRDAEPPPIDDPVRATIDRHHIHVEGPVEPARDVPLGGDPDALRAAIAAVAGPAPRWGFVQLIGGSAAVGTVLGVVEALAAAGVGGVSFEAGALGVPFVAVGEPVVERGAVDPRIVRRHVRQAAVALARCYEDVHAAAPSSAELALEVAADGTAGAVRVTQSGLDPAIEPCIAQAIGKTALWTGKPSAVAVPLDFEPDGGPPRRARSFRGGR